MTKIKNEEKLLKVFCDSDDIREFTKKPFVGKDGMVYATDGKVAIRINPDLLNGHYEQSDLVVPDIHSLFTPFVLTRACSVSLATMAINTLLTTKKKKKICEYVTCLACKGTGEVEWSYIAPDGTEYIKESDCPVCEGIGETLIERIAETEGYEHHGSFVVKGREDRCFSAASFEKILNALRLIDIEYYKLGHNPQNNVPVVFYVNDDIQMIVGSTNNESNDFVIL